MSCDKDYFEATAEALLELIDEAEEKFLASDLLDGVKLCHRCRHSAFFNALYSALVSRMGASDNRDGMMEIIASMPADVDEARTKRAAHFRAH